MEITGRPRATECGEGGGGSGVVSALGSGCAPHGVHHLLSVGAHLPWPPVPSKRAAVRTPVPTQTSGDHLPVRMPQSSRAHGKHRSAGLGVQGAGHRGTNSALW